MGKMCYHVIAEQTVAVTVKHIAAATGLSVPTVILALGRRGRLSVATRQRVLAAAARMGYRPNRSARSMRTGRTGNIAILSSTDQHFSPLHPGVIEGAHDLLAERNLHLMISRLPDTKLAAEDFVPNVLKELVCDGLLINCHVNAPASLAHMIERYRVPAVWMNTKRKSACVCPDDAGAGRMAAGHLLNLGHRRIAFVDFWCSEHHSTVDRFRGFCAAMREAGLDGEALSARTRQRVAGAQRMASARQWLAGADRPTAAVVYGNAYAASVVAAALSLGLEVPRDLSVVSIDAMPLAWGGPVGTTVLTPTHELGRAGAAMVLDLVESPTRKCRPQIVPCSLFEGQTTAPLARNP